MDFDAVLVVSFGGPEKPDDVMPFLENVVRGRNVPRARLEEVAEHYHHFGGKSPINDQNRALASALEAQLSRAGPRLPVYLGNRNWHPLLAETLQSMRRDGVKRALGFITSAYGSYSGCRQYRDNVAEARAVVGSEAPEIVFLRRFHNHPGFVEAHVEHVASAIAEVPDGRLVFTAHSIPVASAASAPYERQLRETARLVAERVGRSEWDFAWQSRSGPPQVPWLEPDILDHLRDFKGGPSCGVVIAPVGFISDHMEVLYDLDVEAKALCDELGLRFARATTPGTHPAFIETVCELVREHTDGWPRRAIGRLPPPQCAPDCCQPPRRRQPITPREGEDLT